MAALWLIGVVFGGVLLVRYQRTAGSVGRTPERWPGSAPIARDADRATLLMFAHPHCPCTRASINELNRLLARCAQPVATHVLFLKPRDMPESWLHTDTWRSAASIPGVQVHEDPLGEQARRFGGSTSGYVTLYDRSGRLLFRGGITAGRGHAGDNEGADAIVAIINGSKTTPASTPVYGCSLFNACDQKMLCEK